MQNWKLSKFRETVNLFNPVSIFWNADGPWLVTGIKKVANAIDPSGLYVFSSSLMKQVLLIQILFPGVCIFQLQETKVLWTYLFPCILLFEKIQKVYMGAVRAHWLKTTIKWSIYIYYIIYMYIYIHLILSIFLQERPNLVSCAILVSPVRIYCVFFFF